MDYNRIAHIFAEKVKAEYREDVAAVVLYQPEVEEERNTAAQIYFIPRTERSKELEKHCLIKECGIEILAYTWTELTLFAKGDRRNAALLFQSELIDTYNDEIAERFCQLQEEAGKSIQRDSQLKNLVLECKELYFSFYEPESDAAAVAVDILEKVSCIVLLHGGSYLKNGWSCLKQEVQELESVPECYEEAVEKLTKTADPQVLKSICRKLIMQTENLVKEPETAAIKHSVEAIYAGVYEHVKVLYQKIVNACFAGNADAALLYAKQLQMELDAAAKKSEEVPKLPNLLDLYYRKDLTSFAVAIYSHEASLMGFLLNHGIQFEQYANIERFEEAMLQTVHA